MFFQNYCCNCQKNVFLCGDETKYLRGKLLAQRILSWGGRQAEGSRTRGVRLPQSTITIFSLIGRKDLMAEAM